MLFVRSLCTLYNACVLTREATELFYGSLVWSLSWRIYSRQHTIYNIYTVVLFMVYNIHYSKVWFFIQCNGRNARIGHRFCFCVLAVVSLASGASRKYATRLERHSDYERILCVYENTLRTDVIQITDAYIRCVVGSALRFGWNEVTLRQAWLALRWVTACGQELL